YILSSEHNPVREHHLATVVSRDVAGLILASTRMSKSQVQSLARDVPTVLINAEVRGVPAVLVSAAGAITDAIAEGVEAGVTGVSYAGSEERWWPNTEREDSARWAANAHHLPYRRLLMPEPTYDAA